MRRSRTGRTPPILLPPSMQKTERHVGQSKVEQNTSASAAAIEETSNTNSTRDVVESASAQTERKTAEPFRNNLLPSEPRQNVLHNLPPTTETSPSKLHPTTSIPSTFTISSILNGNISSPISNAAISAAANLPSVSSGGSDAATADAATASADADDTDDELPTPGCTISYDIRTPIPCIHTVSSTKRHSSRRILSRPYRKTMLSLLHGVCTEPADTYATTGSTGTNRPQIYAGYQQHWNPKFNVPVLTLVAVCDTTISPPQMKRSEPEYVEVSFGCYSQRSQHSITFKLPIFMSLTKAPAAVLIRAGPHNPFPDSLTSWLIVSSVDDDILSWIKVWHLSPIGCYNLHNHGILIPQRPYPESEIHFLGLTGKRTMPYGISQLDVGSTLLSMLDDIDIGNIGYKKFRLHQKPMMPPEGPLIQRIPTQFMPRLFICQEWYYDKGIIKQPETKMMKNIIIQRKKNWH